MMATTEAGRGVPQELRERIAAYAASMDGYDWPLETERELCADDYYQEADKIAQMIAAAGFELVPVERMDRLRNAAGRDDVMNLAWRSLLKPGDLDRPEGRE
jgi:hypothetical protein